MGRNSRTFSFYPKQSFQITVQDTKAYLRQNNMILHHSSRNTAQLISESLYDGIRHTGLASVMRNKQPKKKC